MLDDECMVMVGSCSDGPRALALTFHAYRRILARCTVLNLSRVLMSRWIVVFLRCLAF